MGDSSRALAPTPINSTAIPAAGRGYVPIDPRTGHPLLGRHVVRLEDVHRSFVAAPIFRASTTRREIWDGFVKVLEKTRQTVQLHAIWIGGSFTTWKTNPNDIDVVFVIDEISYNRLTESRDRSFMSSLSSGKSSPQLTRLKVDSYVLHWRPFPKTDFHDHEHQPYLVQRGYWDDWLQRHTNNKESELTEADATLRRGYLEVIFDGYQRAA